MEITSRFARRIPIIGTHTPGPWRRDPNHPGDILAPDGEYLAQTFRMKAENGGDEAEYGNAQAITALPQLLEAVDALLINPDDVNAWQNAQEAAKKAHATA